MQRHVNGSIPCTWEAFGDDPRPGMAKICSCRPGLPWSRDVLSGLNETISRHLVPRVEVGPEDAGCGPEDDGRWTPCSVLSTRFDASLMPDRLLPRLEIEEQQDAALRRLDLCHELAGKGQAMRVLGLWPSNILNGVAPVKATSAPVCAVVYSPALGATWQSRGSVYCPTEPPRCLEGECQCASSERIRVDIRAVAQGEDGESGLPPCYSCMTDEALKDFKSAVSAQQAAAKEAPGKRSGRLTGEESPSARGASAASGRAAVPPLMSLSAAWGLQARVPATSG